MGVLEPRGRQVRLSRPADPRSARSTVRGTSTSTDAAVLRGRRPRALLQAAATVDVVPTAATLAELADWIGQVYVDADARIPVGVFARCHLGGEFVDHRLHLAGGILEHFTRTEQLPSPWSAARPLVRSDAYAFVEVYADGAVVPVRADGTCVT